MILEFQNIATNKITLKWVSKTKKKKEKKMQKEHEACFKTIAFFPIVALYVFSKILKTNISRCIDTRWFEWLY